MKITREQLRKWNACYTDAHVAELIPADGLTPLEIANLGIPAEDRLWVLLRDEIIPARDIRLLACGWAEAACRAVGWDDPRSLNSIAVARRFAVGEATDAELAAARSAAWAAAADSEVLYSASARSAAWSAGWSPWLARSAAEASAEARAAAAWSAAARGSCSAWVACSEAEVAAWAEQLADVVRVIKRLTEAAKAVDGCGMRTIKTSAIKKAIYVDGNNPISGDVAVHVSVDDEGGGPFLVIETIDDDCGKIRIDLDELEAVLVAAREMIAGIEGIAEK